MIAQSNVLTQVRDAYHSQHCYPNSDHLRHRQIALHHLPLDHDDSAKAINRLPLVGWDIYSHLPLQQLKD